MQSVTNPAWTAYVPAGPVPAAPSQVTSIAVDGGATVSWVSPGSGADATSYTITPYIGGAAQAGTTVAAPATSASVTGLANLTAYTFSVHANGAHGAGAESAQSGSNTPRANLIFGDEFNGSYLDPAWTAQSRDGDQSNSETQYYLPANVSLDGSSHLVLNTKAQTVTLPGYNDANPPGYAGANVTRNWTSGAVNWASFGFTYGKVQVNAQVSGGTNLWPAIWMMGHNCQVTTPLNPDNVGTCAWSAAGSEEIDIAEWGGGTNPMDGNYYNPAGNAMAGPTTNPSSPQTTFHTYEVDWSAGSLAWLIDGTQWTTWSTGVVSSNMFLIIQTAIRGTPTISFPNLTVDWVRVFHN